MKILMNRFLLLCLVILSSTSIALADNGISFRANIDATTIAVGQQVRLEYVINSQKIKDFTPPVFKGMQILSGPYQSSSSNIQIINGKTTSSSTTTFTYVITATDEGTYNIPGAKVSVGGTIYTSNPLTVKVLPADKVQSGDNNVRSNSTSSSGTNDLIITAEVNKTNVYEQEPIVLTYKIYTTANLRSVNNAKLPDLKGFNAQEVQLPEDRTYSLERYKGKNYRTYIYRQFVIFPQQSGDITIGPARFDTSIAQEVKSDNVDPFDLFFNGGSNVVEVNRTIVTSKINIKVNPLPLAGKPANFSGAVGDFKIEGGINTDNLKTNDALTYKLTISGVGNFKLIGNPKVEFPADFEQYDPKENSTYSLTNNGLSGKKEIDYLAIPRTPGDYTIPAVKFSFFNPKVKEYKTISTESFQIKVEKGKGSAAAAIANFTNKEDLKMLNNDIRFINLKPVKLVKHGQNIFNSWIYVIYYIVPLLVLILIIIFRYNQIKANANEVRMKNKKANKVAVKRMKTAEKLLAEHNKDAFYDEILKALWGYVSDKLNIPVSSLTKENVQEKLQSLGVENELINEFITILNSAEFAHFAPGNDNQEMSEIYKEALNLISQMESSIKH